MADSERPIGLLYNVSDLLSKQINLTDWLTDLSGYANGT